MEAQERAVGDPITLADFDRLLTIVDHNLHLGLHDPNPEVTGAYRASALASAASAIYLLATDTDMTPRMTESMMATATDIMLAGLLLGAGGDEAARMVMSGRVATSMGRSLALFEQAGEGTDG